MRIPLFLAAMLTAALAAPALRAQTVIPLHQETDGRYTMEASVNGVGVRTYYTPDSWYASVSSTTYMFLYENGYIADVDVNGMTTVKMPNGTSTKAASFVIRNLKIGKVIVQNGGNSIAIVDEDGSDITLDLLADSRRTVLLLFPNLPDVGVVNSFALNELNDAALVANVDVIGLTPATAQEIEHWNDISMASYSIYNMDDSELKMIARGNPAVVYLEDGVIKWKRTLASLDDVEQPMDLAAMGDNYDANAIVNRLMSLYLLIMLGVLVMNRSHLLIRYFLIKRRKRAASHSTDNQSTK